jgi:hypothetical protein
MGFSALILGVINKSVEERFSIDSTKELNNVAKIIVNQTYNIDLNIILEVIVK